jgi:hypothetical protein
VEGADLVVSQCSEGNVAILTDLEITVELLFTSIYFNVPTSKIVNALK